MIKQELARQLAKKTKIDQATATKLIAAFGDTITKALSKGGKVVYSNFGTFYTVHYPSKVIMHPKLGAQKKMIMLPTNAVKWMPSGNIKKLIKASDFEPISRKAKPKTKEVSVPINVQSKPNSELKIPPEERSSNIYEDLMNAAQKKKPENKRPVFGIFDRFNFGKDKTQDEVVKEPAITETAPDPKPELGVDKKLESFDNRNGIFGNYTQSVKDIPIKVESKEKEAESKIATTDPETDPQPDPVAPEPVEAKNEPEIEPKGKLDIPALFAKTKTNISYVDLSNVVVPKDLLIKIPEKMARQYNIVPIEENEKEFIVAMIDPEDIEAKEIIKRITGKNVIAKIATQDDIGHILDQYQGMESEVQEAIENADDDFNSEELETVSEQIEDSVGLEAAASDSAPAARIVSSLLRRSIRDKASDIHIEPADKEVEVRFRIDGVLEKRISLPKDIKSAIVTRIKILANLKIDEQRLPQDGRFSIKIDSRRVDFRVSTMPIVNGEKVVMRVLDKSSGVITLEQLGFKEEDLSIINENLKQPHGMVLVTGPTGSGKTTTLYSMIDRIYSEGINIITLEDPIEYQIPGINQSQVNPTIGYTFASGLRSILRQDPDVIMIGEIRDSETAEMAVHSALTGHIVLSTLHTNTASGAIPRLIDMHIEPFLLTSSLNVIIAQRLARKICPECKEETKLSEEQLTKIKKEIAKMPEIFHKQFAKGIKFYKGKGCKACNNTGYKGRLGLYEVLNVDENIRKLVTSRASATDIVEAATKNGMTTMLQDGIIKAAQGITTIEEVWKATKD